MRFFKELFKSPYLISLDVLPKDFPLVIRTSEKQYIISVPYLCMHKMHLSPFSMQYSRQKEKAPRMIA
jgi:hypothetical protein